MQQPDCADEDAHSYHNSSTFFAVLFIHYLITFSIDMIDLVSCRYPHEVTY